MFYASDNGAHNEGYSIDCYNNSLLTVCCVDIIVTSFLRARDLYVASRGVSMRVESALLC